ncbi:MAG: hypothetical protein E7231_16080 [Cellulosilyticum sp.]|nr:hypothetical protein [Cellulosilyticum sp.]
MYKTRDINLLEETLKRYESIIHCPYLSELSDSLIATPSCSEEPIHIFQIHSLPNTDTYQHFTYILNALAALHQTIGCLLINRRGKQSLYLMIKGHHDCAFALLQNGLSTTFPDIQLSTIEHPLKFLENIFDFRKYCCLTSSLSVPNQSYTPLLLNQFITLMGAQSNYFAFFLASPIPKSEISKYLDELYELHQLLSDFSQTTYTNYKSDSKSITSSTAKGSTHNSSEANTTSCNEGSSESRNCYTNLSASTPFTLVAHRPSRPTRPTALSQEPRLPHSSIPPTIIPKQPVASGSSTLPHTSPNSSTSIQSTASSNSSSREPQKNINATALLNSAKGTSCNFGSSKSRCLTSSHSQSLTSTDGNSISQTNYHSLSYTSPNKYIQDAIITLNETIIRYQSLSKNTAFCFSSYFFSPQIETSLRAAYTFNGLTASTYTLSPNTVNSWCLDTPQYDNLFIFLSQLEHPLFCVPCTDSCLSHTVPILSTELINSIYLPIT